MHQNDNDLTKTEYHEWNIETMPHRKSPTLEHGIFFLSFNVYKFFS